VFIEDDADLRPTPVNPTDNQSALSTPGSMGPPKSGKVDVYHMIVNQLLHTLRLHVDRQIPLDSPFSTLGFDDLDALHQSFAKAIIIQVTLPGKRKTSTGILSSTPTRGAPAQEVTLKITKVGSLSRSDEESRKGNRKWKSWTVVLTGSQLLFIKDPIMAITLSERIKQIQAGTRANSTLLPPMPNFKPDEVISLKDCIAVHDNSVTRAQATFRLIMPQRQFLLTAPDEGEMKDWMGLANYASTFKSAGIRMRGISMKKEQVVLAGAAAAASHKRDIDHAHGTDITPKKAFFGDTSAQVQSNHIIKSSPERSRPDASGGVIEVDDMETLVNNEGEQLEEVFDVVKAELAAGRGPGQKRPTSSTTRDSDHHQPGEFGSTTNQAQVSRSAAFTAKIDEFSGKKDDLLAQLATAMTTARNLAILTPFQKPTRDKLSLSIPPLASSIKADRLHLAKYEHYISILKRELEVESQEWATVRHVALQAAAKSLRHPEGVKAVVDDVNIKTKTKGLGDLPKLALPDSDFDTDSLSPLTPSPMMGTSPGEWPILMLRSESNDQRESDQRRTRPVRQSSTASSTSQSRPRLQRSTSSQLSIRSNGQDPDTGRSTPVMFSLSESETEQDPVRSSLREEEMSEVERGGTVRAKKTPYPALAKQAVNGQDSTIQSEGLSAPRKKREREVTAVYIGPTT